MSGAFKRVSITEESRLESSKGGRDTERPDRADLLVVIISEAVSASRAGSSI
jgi:hypothetical protein